MVDFNKFKGKYVFISHPYSDDPKGNRAKVDKICRYLKKHGIIPISPLHLFSFFDGDEGKREKIMYACHRLQDFCSATFMFGRAPGCLQEEKYAKKINQPVIKFYPEVKDINFKSIMNLMREHKGVEL